LVQSIIRGEVEELISGEEVWGLEVGFGVSSAERLRRELSRTVEGFGVSSAEGGELRAGPAIPATPTSLHSVRGQADDCPTDD
jgi:hypothetical protein